jgi:hypothetical protein
MTDRDLKPDNVFSESTYRASPASVIAHAVETGRAVVVREDGSVRVVISIPKALCPHGSPDLCRDCEREKPGRVIPEDNSRRRGRRRIRTR